MQTFHLADGGVVRLDPEFLPAAEASQLLIDLKQQVPWKQEVGRNRYPFPRLTAWYADPGISYRYSGVTHLPEAWLPLLADVRRKVEQAADYSFNSMLLNYYRHGRDSIGFHADDEPELGTNPLIASLSLGATRTFILRHNRTAEKRTYDLTHGSLLIMSGTLQHFWKHSVPKTTAAVGERINLTFRRTRPSK